MLSAVLTALHELGKAESSKKKCDEH